MGASSQTVVSRSDSNFVTSVSTFLSSVSSRSRSMNSIEYPTTLLHGTLEITILEAKDLPNMDTFHEKLKFITGHFEKLTGKAGKEGKNPSSAGTQSSDPYVIVLLAGAKVARTRVISNNVNPKWNEHFSIPVAHNVHQIMFHVKDQDVIGTEYIGDVLIPVEHVLNDAVVDGWFDLLDLQGQQCHPGAKLRITMHYTPEQQKPYYNQGLGSDESLGVQGTYFPSRKGCRLTLFQDAHVYDDCLPKIELDGGKAYEHGRCWEEICSAIYDAQHLIYITGWSVYDKVKLIRDKNRPDLAASKLTLGDLLKKKAADGVRVLLLVWDDVTSHDMLLRKVRFLSNLKFSCVFTRIEISSVYGDLPLCSACKLGMLTDFI